MNALKGNLWRRLVLPTRIGSCSLTSLRQRLVKTGGRLVKHARYYWLLLAESHLTRRLFGGMVRRIDTLPTPAGVELTAGRQEKSSGREGAATDRGARNRLNKCRSVVLPSRTGRDGASGGWRAEQY